MNRRLPALTLAVAFAAGAVLAQEGDSLQSADCRRALDALQAQEARAAAVPEPARRQADAAWIKMLRQRAALACLGARADLPQRPQRFAQPPLAVPPVTVPPAVDRPLLPGALETPRPGRVEPPVTVMNCDALGCWASDGSRLQRVGPQLLGPSGFCSAPAGVLQCP